MIGSRMSVKSCSSNLAAAIILALPMALTSAPMSTPKRMVAPLAGSACTWYSCSSASAT